MWGAPWATLSDPKICHPRLTHRSLEIEAYVLESHIGEDLLSVVESYELGAGSHPPSK